MFTQGFHDVGSVLLNVAVGPANGSPLVLLHGVLRGWRDFAPLWPALVPRWQVYGVDLRGHGLSGRCAGHYFVKDYAVDVIELSKHLPTGAVLFGHSLGALAAAAVAAALPGRVRGVILEDPPPPSFLAHVEQSPWHAVWKGMQGLAGRAGRSTAEVARDLAELRVPAGEGRETRLGELRDASSLRFSARCLQTVDPGVLTPLLENRWLEGYDAEHIFARVRCPALVLRGEEALGGMLGVEEARKMTTRMADGLLVDVAGAGHLIHWQAGEATARVVLGFLESL
jgi:pimeloyl-ACP methyl ester carboxylesterase